MIACELRCEGNGVNIMSDILIDNASVSSSLRALGYIPADKSVIEVDQAALERLTESILLSNKVIIPDNYKSKYTEERKSIFNHECFEFINVEKEMSQNLDTLSENIVKVWAAAYNKQTKKGSLRSYFEYAHSYLEHTWGSQMGNSEEYLIYSAFEINKSNPLISAFIRNKAPKFKHFSVYPKGDEYNESDEYFCNGYDEFKLIGDEMVKSKNKDDMINARKLITILAWLGKEYIWHQSFAAKKDFKYFPHPLREFFAVDFKDHLDATLFHDYRENDLIRNEIEKYHDTTNIILDKYDIKRYKTEFILPIFMPFILDEANSGKEYLDIVIAMREDHLFRELRKLLSEIDDRFIKGDVRPFMSLVEDIEKIGNSILREKGIKKEYITVSPPFRIFGINISSDIAQFKFQIPPVLFGSFFERKNYRFLLKNIMGELALMPKLGTYKDKINKFANYKTE